jgi:hypothetical protein
LNKELIEQATEIWDNGTMLSVHVEDVHNTLYRYEGKLYVFWYTQANLLYEIEEVDEAKARKLFPNHKS